MLVSLSELTVALTIGVVIVAIRRLQLYEATYGLTMLRLASLVSAAWICIVFVLLALTIPRRGLPRRWFPAAVMLSGLIVVGMWSISDPVSIVVQTDLRRAQHGQQFDVIQAASLGSDAVPTLVAGLQQLDTSQAAELRQAICARSPDEATGTASTSPEPEPTGRQLAPAAPQVEVAAEGPSNPDEPVKSTPLVETRLVRTVECGTRRWRQAG